MTTTVSPARRIIHLHNLEYLYLQQGEACDVGWMLIHLNIPVSTKVRIYVVFDDGARTAIPFDLSFELALPNHSGFPHLINRRRCTYAVEDQQSCVITTPNFAFNIAWNDSTREQFDELMMPFLRRPMAAGAIEDLTVIHDDRTLR